MTALWIALAVLAVAVLVGWLLVGRNKPINPTSRTSPTTERPSASAPQRAAPTPFVPKEWVIPEALAQFRRVEGFELPPERVAALRERLLALPRPAAAAFKLLSGDFMDSASADALAQEILSEPHLAAQVLATVNSPFYGLARPVASVQDAITYLGRDTVRSVAVRCLIEPALAPADARLSALYDNHARASRLAAQLCQMLARRVGLPDSGAMVTAAVLSYVGHMAMLAMRAPEASLQDAGKDFLERSQHEQDEVGIAAGELGCLLLEAWNMPVAIVEDVRQIDLVVTTPPKQLSAQKATRYALTYYCVRVADKLAAGTWTDLEAAVPERLVGPEFFHAQTHFMVDPKLAQLAQEMRAPQVVDEVQRMLKA